MSARYLELMEEKNSAIERVLKITRDEYFSGEQDDMEREAEAFAKLYGKREGIIGQIGKIDDALKAESEAMGLPPGGSLVSEKYRERLAAIVEKQKAMAAALLILDEANIKAYEKLKIHLQGGLKNVRQNMELSEKYIDDFDGHESFYFDKKN
ncbi:MAG: hypothetical protein LBE35_08520 [Clostridiales bacterium]|jgi:hypothetical protein|nr:hypothetical protein [Clostridiales bacterium]